jgi:hypothetical protein
MVRIQLERGYHLGAGGHVVVMRDLDALCNSSCARRVIDYAGRCLGVFYLRPLEPGTVDIARHERIPILDAETGFSRSVEDVIVKYENVLLAETHSRSRVESHF